jgi:hypothetical protein
MPSFLRGMFEGRRPTTTTRGSTALVGSVDLEPWAPRSDAMQRKVRDNP